MTQEDSERFNGQVGRLAPRRFATRVFVFFFFFGEGPQSQWRRSCRDAECMLMIVFLL